MKTENSTQYKGIFKSTLLFGFVQIFKLIIGVAKNKIAAVLLGPDGIGIIGIFVSTNSLLQTGAGLGISQSAVRDVSEAKGSSDNDRISRIIYVTQKVTLFTGLLGLLIAIVLAPWLSKWTMGDKSYTIAYILLGFAVAFNIITEGQLAILKGMRQLRNLAKATMIGAVVGFVTAVPLYYLFDKSGIVPALIIAAFSAMFFSNYYTKKINSSQTSLSLKEVYQLSGPMIKMGITLMFITFLSSLAAVMISAYIRSVGGLEDVGFYTAGMAITNSYFGVVITALSTDYYPRIAAVNHDNKKIEGELNRQSSVSLIFIGPLIVVFLVFLPWIVSILYSKDFTPTLGFLKYAIYGTIITICSNQIDMILIAKYKIKLFSIIAVIYRVLQVIISILLYNSFGLVGMGISIAVMGLIHLIVMSIVVYKQFKISYNYFFVKISIIVLILTLAASGINEIGNVITRLFIGSLLIIVTLLFSLIISKKYFDIDIAVAIKTKFFTKPH